MPTSKEVELQELEQVEEVEGRENDREIEAGGIESAGKKDQDEEGVEPWSDERKGGDEIDYEAEVEEATRGTKEGTVQACDVTTESREVTSKLSDRDGVRGTKRRNEAVYGGG